MPRPNPPTFLVPYIDATGQTVGYLGKLGLMVRKRGNAPVCDGLDLPSARRRAAMLLEGPHPFDHHPGPIAVGVEELEDSPCTK